MNYFYRMLRSANLQNVSNLFQSGGELEELDSRDMEERADMSLKVLKQELEKTVPEVSYQKVIETARQYANECCEIYFTIGMKAGAKLMFQLLNDSLNDD